MKTRCLAFIVAIGSAMGASLLVTAQEQKKDEPSGQMSGMHSNEEMNKRGDHVMGFDHTKTTHHFRLLPQGGAIEVSANSAEDLDSRNQIRKHLGHIAKMFAAGNFHTPMLIHSQTPPGTSTMTELKKEIQYEFEETERGGTIHITSKNSQALDAIHTFLRFQIKEHQTGDSSEVTMGPL